MISKARSLCILVLVSIMLCSVRTAAFKSAVKSDRLNLRITMLAQNLNKMESEVDRRLTVMNKDFDYLKEISIDKRISANLVDRVARNQITGPMLAEIAENQISQTRPQNSILIAMDSHISNSTSVLDYMPAFEVVSLQYRISGAGLDAIKSMSYTIDKQIKRTASKIKHAKRTIDVLDRQFKEDSKSAEKSLAKNFNGDALQNKLGSEGMGLLRELEDQIKQNDEMVERIQDEKKKADKRLAIKIQNMEKSRKQELRHLKETEKKTKDQYKILLESKYKLANMPESAQKSDENKKLRNDTLLTLNQLAFTLISIIDLEIFLNQEAEALLDHKELEFIVKLIEQEKNDKNPLITANQKTQHFQDNLVHQVNGINHSNSAQHSQQDSHPSSKKVTAPIDDIIKAMETTVAPTPISKKSPKVSQSKEINCHIQPIQTNTSQKTLPKVSIASVIQSAQHRVTSPPPPYSPAQTQPPTPSHSHTPATTIKPTPTTPAPTTTHTPSPTHPHTPITPSTLTSTLKPLKLSVSTVKVDHQAITPSTTATSTSRAPYAALLDQEIEIRAALVYDLLPGSDTGKHPTLEQIRELLPVANKWISNKMNESSRSEYLNWSSDIHDSVSKLPPRQQSEILECKIMINGEMIQNAKVPVGSVIKGLAHRRGTLIGA